MLKLIQTEFLKLRRRKFVWLMLLAALFMPFFALFYFQRIGETGIDPVQFYKWTAFSYTPWIILPVVLGMLCTMLMYDENQYNMLKQLWIVPVNPMGYFFSKFVVVLFYSVLFMVLTAVTSILAGVYRCFPVIRCVRTYRKTRRKGGGTEPLYVRTQRLALLPHILQTRLTA